MLMLCAKKAIMRSRVRAVGAITVRSASTDRLSSKTTVCERNDDARVPKDEEYCAQVHQHAEKRPLYLHKPLNDLFRCMLVTVRTCACRCECYVLLRIWTLPPYRTKRQRSFCNAHAAVHAAHSATGAMLAESVNKKVL